MKCKKKTDKICCKICEYSIIKLGTARKKLKMKLSERGFVSGRGFVFSLDALFAVMIATTIIGATFFLLSHAQQDYFRELQMAKFANDALIVLSEQAMLQTHNKSSIKHALIETLPTNFGARLRIFPYECADAQCTQFVPSIEKPAYEIIKGLQTPVDVMMLMDTSSSMSDGPKDPSCDEWWCKWFFGGCDWCTGGIADAKAAGISFLDYLYFEKDRGGLTTFGSSAEVKQSLTSNKSSIVSEISSIDVPCSCTDIQYTALGDAIDVANQEFETNGRPNAEWVMVLLSDGKTTTGQDPIDAAQDSVDDNITIYTIGLGGDADEDTLQQIANMTGGEYYYSPTGAQLEIIYSEIAREIFRISHEVVTARRGFLTFNETGVKYYCETEMGVWLI